MLIKPRIAWPMNFLRQNYYGQNHKIRKQEQQTPYDIIKLFKDVFCTNIFLNIAPKIVLPPDAFNAEQLTFCQKS